MVTRDRFSEYYGELLDATYDCVDRIVVNAYFPLGQSGGGFRMWWRALHGDDTKLDNAHLMRMAGPRSAAMLSKFIALPSESQAV